MRKIYCDECKKEIEKDDLMKWPLTYTRFAFDVQVYPPSNIGDLCMECGIAKSREIICGIAGSENRLKINKME